MSAAYADDPDVIEFAARATAASERGDEAEALRWRLADLYQRRRALVPPDIRIPRISRTIAQFEARRADQLQRQRAAK